MKTIELEYAISRRYDVRRHTIVPNVSWGLLDHEADVLVVRETGHCIEYEIKRSYADFVKDFEKRKWKRLLTPSIANGRLRHIKEFWYAFPDDLWKKKQDAIMELIPDFAGILVVYKAKSPDFPWAKAIRDAVPDNNVKPLNAKQILKVAQLGTMRIWNLKHQIIKIQKQ